jgi:hypothetical protein
MVPSARDSGGAERDAPASAGRGSGNPNKCDKCDGKHPTDGCPHFRKGRENHPDALRRSAASMGSSTGRPETLRGCRIVPQPGDGSCLFHSISYGLRDGSSASVLRRQIAAFIERNPMMEISDTPLRDWIRWDSGANPSTYARRMATGGWGGGIEMAAASHLKQVNVHVYEQGRGGFKRISCFEVPRAQVSEGCYNVVGVSLTYGGATGAGESVL